MFARLAGLLGPISLAAILPGCGEPESPKNSPPPPPPPTAAAELLLPAAGPRCTNAFSGGWPASARSGLVRGPAIALIQSDFSQLSEKYREGNPPLGTWRPHGASYEVAIIPTRAKTVSPDAVQTLVCVRQTYNQVGRYSSNHPAVRLDWDVRVVRWPSGEPMSRMTFHRDPPQQADFKGWSPCTETSKCATKSGGQPSDEALRWLDEVIAR
jgi:hypothetical protein